MCNNIRRDIEIIKDMTREDDIENMKAVIFDIMERSATKLSTWDALESDRPIKDGEISIACIGLEYDDHKDQFMRIQITTSTSYNEHLIKPCCDMELVRQIKKLGYMELMNI